MEPKTTGRRADRIRPAAVLAETSWIFGPDAVFECAGHDR